MAELGAGGDVREAVRSRYAATAQPASREQANGCCGRNPCCEHHDAFGGSLYEGADRDAVPESVRGTSLGCGNPTVVADLHEGETVLDLGSGGGTDLLLSARRVGPSGKVYGLDMTDEMLALARKNLAAAGATNVELIKGYIESIPMAGGSVDVVISNCVMNLSDNKPQAFSEAVRVLRPGGRLAISDVIADDDMDERTRRDMEAWTGCIAGALTRGEFIAGLHAAGLVDIEIRETHRVHSAACSAIIRARKPDQSHSDTL